MLKAILLTGYFLSVPTAMLAPAVFAHGPVPASTDLKGAPRASSHATVFQASLRSADQGNARPAARSEGLAE